MLDGIFLLPLLATLAIIIGGRYLLVVPGAPLRSSAMDGYAVAGVPPWRLVTPYQRILAQIFTV